VALAVLPAVLLVPVPLAALPLLQAARVIAAAATRAAEAAHLGAVLAFSPVRWCLIDAPFEAWRRKRAHFLRQRCPKP
jgi:hypothetical protein